MRKLINITFLLIFILGMIGTFLVYGEASSGHNIRFYFSLVSAIYIPICFIYFFRRIDIFEKEKWTDLILVFLAGCSSVFLLSELILPFRNELFTSLWTDYPTFFDMFFGVAVLEEITKIIPVLIILRRTDVMNEPIDYIIYSSVSALGFVFIENIDYIYMYSESSTNIIAVRSFLPSVLHMVTTSILGYGLFLFIVSRKFKYIFWSFLAACLIHTLYNLFGTTLSLIILLVSAGYFSNITRDLLELSPFYDKEKIKNVKSDYRYMFFIIAGVLIMDFIFEISYSGSYDIRQVFYLGAGGYYIFSSFMSGSFGMNKDEPSKNRGDNLHHSQREIINNYYKRINQ